MANEDEHIRKMHTTDRKRQNILQKQTKNHCYWNFEFERQTDSLIIAITIKHKVTSKEKNVFWYIQTSEFTG